MSNSNDWRLFELAICASALRYEHEYYAEHSKPWDRSWPIDSVRIMESPMLITALAAFTVAAAWKEESEKPLASKRSQEKGAFVKAFLMRKQVAAGLGMVVHALAGECRENGAEVLKVHESPSANVRWYYIAEPSWLRDVLTSHLRVSAYAHEFADQLLGTYDHLSSSSLVLGESVRAYLAAA